MTDYSKMKKTDDHCPDCGAVADCMTHNIAEMVVWVCSKCDAEWPAFEYPIQVEASP